MSHGPAGHHADVAQLAEQRFRKPQVTSSSLVVGSLVPTPARAPLASSPVLMPGQHARAGRPSGWPLDAYGGTGRPPERMGARGACLDVVVAGDGGCAARRSASAAWSGGSLRRIRGHRCRGGGTRLRVLAPAPTMAPSNNVQAHLARAPWEPTDVCCIPPDRSPYWCPGGVPHPRMKCACRATHATLVAGSLPCDFSRRLAVGEVFSHQSPLVPRRGAAPAGDMGATRRRRSPPGAQPAVYVALVTVCSPPRTL